MKGEVFSVYSCTSLPFTLYEVSVKRRTVPDLNGETRTLSERPSDSKLNLWILTRFSNETSLRGLLLLENEVLDDTSFRYVCLSVVSRRRPRSPKRVVGQTVYFKGGVNHHFDGRRRRHSLFTDLKIFQFLQQWRYFLFMSLNSPFSSSFSSLFDLNLTYFLPFYWL